MPEPYRVLVTGSRSWTDEGVIHDALSGPHFKRGSPIILVHGASPRGADAIADHRAAPRNAGEHSVSRGRASKTTAALEVSCTPGLQRW